MKRVYKTGATTKRPAARRLEPMQPWNGKPTTIKLNGYSDFMTTNHLSARRSWIAEDENGVLRIKIEVVDETKAIV